MWCAAAFTAVLAFVWPGAGVAAPHPFPAGSGFGGHVPAGRFAPQREVREPWVEGVTPPLEDRLFDATYRVLPNHNILKVYVFDAAGYESAGIRFSGRVPHQPRDLSAPELYHEAALLIRTAFATLPNLQTVDVWATIPVPHSQATMVESTIFSVSADRQTYERQASTPGLSDAQFLSGFGRLWVAPEVPGQ